jgi:hypothetical protein
VLIRTLATILAVTLGGSMAFAVPQLPCSSVPEYRALLVHLGQASEAPAVDADELIAQVPVECKVEAVGKQFQFSTIHIHAQLFAIKTAEGEDRAAKIQALREGLARQVKALDGYTNHIDPTAQPKLNQIFTRGEFNRVGKQNADAIIREKLFGLLVALFTFIAKNPAQAALFAEAFAWSIAGVVAVLIIWKLYRWATVEHLVRAPRKIVPFSPSSKTWQQWMKEARAALANEEFREAVHSSYWAAISSLESSGAWTPDKARTPREYLRLIAGSDPARTLLADISQVFEVVWYGKRVPARAECEEFLARVEQIACR